MMTHIYLLFQLQKLDSEIDEKKKRLGEVLLAQKEPAALLKMRKRAETAASNLQTWQGKHKDLTLEHGTISSKAESSETRLYSGKVTNPKELADLQQEVEALGRRKSVLEDGILEAVVTVDDTETEKTTADGELETAVTDWEQKSAHLKTDQNKLALNLHKLMQSRKIKAAKIDASQLNEYGHLRQQKKGVAVAGLRGNMCLGCSTTVSAQKARDVDEGRKIYCGGCGRLLAAV
ncbi:MAG: hypothetical protein GY805_25305 [Chloroflexi bacterium]|nr:hypothetical protein [Chloroflexota bacterium]